MSRWPQKNLLEVARLTRGTEPGSGSYTDSSRGVRFLRVGDITGKTNNPAYTNAAQTVLVSETDVLLALDGSPGHISTGHSGAISSGLRKVEPIDPNKVSLDWLRYSLMSPDIQHTISKYTNGVTILHASSAVPHVSIPIPPVSEQDRIVKILDEAEELRRLRAEADHRTADLIPALFLEMFGDPSANPFGWPTVSAGTIFDESRNGAKCGPFGSALKKDEYVDSGIPVWGIPNVLPNQFVETGSLFISPLKFSELQTYSVKSGDLLISRAGTVGRICVARPQAKDSIIGTNLIRIALDLAKVVPEFFSTLMTYFAEHAGRLRADSDQGAYSFMSTTVLKTLQINLPPFNLQQEFADRVAELRALQGRQATSKNRLNYMFQSLLHRAFQGDL